MRRLDRIRKDIREISDLFRKIHFFTHEFDRQAIGMMLIGLALAGWDIFVPVVGSQVIDAMADERPFQEVALMILGLTMIIWLPHGNLLPYLLDVFDIKKYSVKLLGSISIRSMRLAFLNPKSCNDFHSGEMTAYDAQPIVVEARENITKLMLRIVRDIPVAVRGLCILGLLLYMVPLFVPFLLLGAVANLAITYRMGVKLEPHFQARQDAENAQRRLEAELLAEHFGKVLSKKEVDAIMAPYEAGVHDRIEKEIAAEAAALRYRLERDLIFNATNIMAWLMGAWYIIVGGNPLGSFLFFVAWSSRAGEFFVVVMNIQQELMRSRRSVRQLGYLVGLEQESASPEVASIGSGSAVVLLPGNVCPLGRNS